MKREAIGYDHPVGWLAYVWHELDYYGGHMTKPPSRVRGAWSLLKQCVPQFHVNEEGGGFIAQLFAVPTRDCDEAELWTLGVEVSWLRTVERVSFNSYPRHRDVWYVEVLRGPA